MIKASKKPSSHPIGTGQYVSKSLPVIKTNANIDVTKMIIAIFVFKKFSIAAPICFVTWFQSEIKLSSSAIFAPIPMLTPIVAKIITHKAKISYHSKGYK